MASRIGRKFDKDEIIRKRKKTVKDRETQRIINHRVQAMIPEVIIAVDSLQLATPESIHSFLRQRNIDATKSEMEMALEYGCKTGIMRERRRYRLNPEIRRALMKESSDSKKCSPNSGQKLINPEGFNWNGGCSSVSQTKDYKTSCSDLSVKRYKSDDVESYSNDYEDEDEGGDSADDSDTV